MILCLIKTGQRVGHKGYLTLVFSFDSFIVDYSLTTVTVLGGSQDIKVVENLAQNQIGGINCHWNGGFFVSHGRLISTAFTLFFV